MWGLLPLQPVIPSPWPRNPIATPHRPPNHPSTAVDCLQDSQQTGISRRESITTLQSNAQNRQNTEKPTTKTPPLQQQNQESEERQKQRQLSGSVILMALERAATQKSQTKKVARNNASAISRGSNSSGREAKGTPDFSHVKPFSIKAEWSDRLEEMENRLQEFLHC